jgi:hypothetical protein
VEIQQLLQEQQKNMMELLGQQSPGSLEYSKILLAGAGTQTAALAFGGGLLQELTSATEEYNGTTWTTGNSMNSARRS